MNINDVFSAAEGITNTIAGLFGSPAGSWRDNVRTAKYRDVPFGVFQSEMQFGRRNAVHEYPNRDVVWVEDLGRAARRVSFSAFLIEDSLVYGGGGVVDQMNKLIAACEKVGEGELQHPTLGLMQVSCVEAAVVNRWDSGRVVELSMAFVESGVREFPGTILDTAGDILDMAAKADEAIGTDFFSKAVDAIKSGITSVQQAVRVAAKWAAIAQGVIRNATNIYQTLRNLRGSFGRYKGLAGITMGIQATSNSIKRLLAFGAQARNAVSDASKALTESASKVGADQ